MSSENKSFTASDIERYHSGKMTLAEMHALEKAALDDPFLADALEGYAFTSTPAIDLAKIQLRLNEKKDRKKIVPFYQKYKWLSAAAIFIIIAAAGWFAYTVSVNEKSIAISREKKQITQDSNKVVTSPQKNSVDSVDYTDNLTAQQPVENRQSKTTAKKESKKQNITVTNQKYELTIQSDKLVTENNKEKSRDESSERSRFGATKNNVTGNDIASNNTRLNAVQPRGLQRNNAISPDPRSNNIARTNMPREQLYYKEVTDNAVKTEDKARRVNINDSITDLHIVLQPLPKDSQQVLQEVVVSPSLEKKSVEKYPRVTIDTLEPAEGYVHFDDYVVNNLKMPEEVRTKTITGEVQLSFDVDKDGQPTNITVVKSLCDKCDEEAIRLLKEGPKWKKKKNRKGKVTIKF